MKWHAYRTVPQKERIAAEVLATRYGLNAWCPIERKFKRGRNKAVETTYPLLVGYILVQSHEWWRPLQHHMILSIVGFGGVPASICETAIERLRKISGTHIPHHSAVNMRSSFAPGDVVRVTQGPLTGYEAKVKSTTDKSALLKLGLLGRDEVEISVKSLEAA
jgi:transcription antitermination factor NusG